MSPQMSVYSLGKIPRRGLLCQSVHIHFSFSTSISVPIRKHIPICTCNNGAEGALFPTPFFAKISFRQFLKTIDSIIESLILNCRSLLAFEKDSLYNNAAALISTLLSIYIM